MDKCGKESEDEKVKGKEEWKESEDDSAERAVEKRRRGEEKREIQEE